jgi:hypothetical protein
VRNDPWIGGEWSTPPKARLGIIAHRPLDFFLENGAVGLLIDELSEVVPEGELTTGVAVHADEPASHAPQCILLAVSPSARTEWLDADLVECIVETAELARIRAVDADSLRAVGHYLPALYYPINLAGDSISTDFSKGT